MKGCKLKYFLTNLKIFMKTNLITITILSASTLVSFVCSYFWNLTLNHTEQYMALVGVLFADGFFGIWAGTKREGFKTYKALKLLKSLFFWLILLTTILSIETAFPGTEWLSETIIAPFLFFQLASILKNSSMLGLIPMDILKNALEKIDQHKNTKPEE